MQCSLAVPSLFLQKDGFSATSPLHWLVLLALQKCSVFRLAGHQINALSESG